MGKVEKLEMDYCWQHGEELVSGSQGKGCAACSSNGRGIPRVAHAIEWRGLTWRITSIYQAWRDSTSSFVAISMRSSLELFRFRALC